MISRLTFHTHFYALDTASIHTDTHHIYHTNRQSYISVFIIISRYFIAHTRTTTYIPDTHTTSITLGSCLANRQSYISIFIMVSQYLIAYTHTTTYIPDTQIHLPHRLIHHAAPAKAIEQFTFIISLWF